MRLDLVLRQALAAGIERSPKASMDSRRGHSPPFETLGGADEIRLPVIARLIEQAEIVVALDAAGGRMPSEPVMSGLHIGGDACLSDTSSGRSRSSPRHSRHRPPS